MRRLAATLLLAATLPALGQVAAKDWMKDARDAVLFQAATNHAPEIYREVSTQTDAFALPDASGAATNDVLTLAWTPVPPTSSNGLTAGFLLWRSLNGEPPALILSTPATQVDVDAIPGTYYVSATNESGASPMSLGLVFPKPVTNVLTFSASVPNWPAFHWTNKPTAAACEFFAVRYTKTSNLQPATFNASVVFSPNLNIPLDAWQPFEPWPPVTTTNRNLQLFWKLESF